MPSALILSSHVRACAHAGGRRLPMFWPLDAAIVGARRRDLRRDRARRILAIGLGHREAGQAIGLRPARMRPRFVASPQALRALDPGPDAASVAVIKESPRLLGWDRRCCTAVRCSVDFNRLLVNPAYRGSA